MLTAERLREVLDYCPDDGRFYWRVHNSRTEVGGVAGRLRRHDGYWSIKIDQRDYLAHRLVWLWTFGRWPIEVDHINRDRNDNRIENLRECTRSQNFANRRRKAGKELPKGVRRSHDRYTARIIKKKKEYHLGTFDSPEEAQAAYIYAAKKLYGEFASDGSIVRATRER